MVLDGHCSECDGNGYHSVDCPDVCVKVVDIDDISQLPTAGTFPGIYVTLRIPVEYFVESINADGGGTLNLTLRKRFAKK